MKKIRLEQIIIFFIATIFTISCDREELFIDTIQNFETELKKDVKKISLDDLQSKQELNKTLQNLSRKFDINNAKSKSSNKASKIDANDGSFTILTDNIRETSTDSTRTYSFLLEKPTLSTSAFENFVIERQRDSTYNFYIYHFEANPSQKDFPYTITTSLLDNDLIVNTNFFVSLLSKGCGGGHTELVDVYGWHCECCGGGCGNHNPEWGNIGQEAVWVWDVVPCGQRTYSNPSSENWSIGDFRGTSYGGTNLHDPSSPIAIIPPTMSQQLSRLITLTSQQEVCSNKPYNKKQVEDLISYLLTNNNQNNTTANQQQAQIFGQSAIDAICNGGGVDYENEIILECPRRDMVKDSSGNCVKKPCVGDPVANVEIVSSGSSGKKGGTFGCTRTDNTICEGVSGKKYHNGLDIHAPVNQNAFAMYSGTISSIRNTFSPGEYKKDSYGNFIVITTVIDGITYNIKYNHLNTVSVIQGQRINSGDIIGLTGNTGNANSPTSEIIPHIHLQVFNSNWSQSLNPEDFLKTKFDSNHNAISNNCQ